MSRFGRSGNPSHSPSFASSSDCDCCSVASSSMAPDSRSSLLTCSTCSSTSRWRSSRSYPPSRVRPNNERRHGTCLYAKKERKRKEITCFLVLSLSSRAFLAASSCARFIRCCFRLWKPVRNSCRASLSKETCSTPYLRFLLGGGRTLFFGLGFANMLLSGCLAPNSVPSVLIVKFTVPSRNLFENLEYCPFSISAVHNN